MTFPTRRTKSATGGSLTGKYRSPRVSVCFDKAMFERLIGEAARRQVTFGEIVREKVLQAYRMGKAV